MRIRARNWIVSPILMTVSCTTATSPGPNAAGKLTKTAFGVELYTLDNGKGMKVAVTNYGGIITAIEVPDRDGKLGDVALGFDSLEGYWRGHPYFGAIIGRYGNRIGKARFTLGGVEYRLAANNGENHLHGGIRGFDKALWTPRDVSTADTPGLELRYLSKDGEEGYPGNLAVKVTYRVTPQNELRIDYEASTDRDTIVNLTNHTYFNLAGQGNGDILKHELMLAAEHFTPVDAGLIPTGEIRPVKGTPFDFTQPTSVGAHIDADDEQLRYGKGYDHNFVLSKPDGALALAARVREPSSGRVMEVFTTEPGVQFYTGNFLDGTIVGKQGKVYHRRYGFCLETQHFPDSPNKPAFPSVVLRPSMQYRSTTIYRFSSDRK